MRFLLAAIGYAAVATVVSVALGVGYLWQTERLTDERLFRIVAIVHGVNLDKAAEQKEPERREIPPEEPSLAEQERVRQIALRGAEVQMVTLERGQKEFQHSLSQLMRERDRFDEMARELEKRLNQEAEEAVDEGVEAVVRDLTLAKPDMAKELLLKMFDRGVTPEEKQRAKEDVVRVIERMSTDTWQAILKKFEGEQELAQLHELELLQLEGGPKQRVLTEALDMLGRGGA
ncbi:hypothetical protein [Botrimarina sp.]|uniref:hypothetical protein n=1 Tax=Botrimarina sp. TaxID=2795802 RepID=UPI0032F0910D